MKEARTTFNRASLVWEGPPRSFLLSAKCKKIGKSNRIPRGTSPIRPPPEDFHPQNFTKRESTMSSGFVKTAVLNVGEVCHGDEKKLDSDVVKLQTFRNLQSVSSFKSRCARTSNNDTNSCTCRRQALSTTS